ncbi:MAG: hypothetical protein J7M26_09685, partial [Armatimonadetes bacterium]|nr:hypothetical protein [Armatimonadota bacterium]
HPHWLRYVVHPHMVTIPCMAVRRGRTTVGLLWHSRSKWADGSNRPQLSPDRSDVDRPSSLFASPDKPAGHASSALGLFLPTVPEYVEPNERQAKEPWPAGGVGAREIRLLSAVYVNPASDSAMDIMRAWFDLYGVASPRPLPHVKTVAGRDRSSGARGPNVFRGYALPVWAQRATRKGQWFPYEPSRQAWIGEIEWSMQAYLKTLWDEEEQGWKNFIGGPMISRSTGPRPDFLYDCIMGASLTKNAALRKQLEDRISLMKKLAPWVLPTADDLGFNFASPTAALLGMANGAAGTMSSQDSDGGWRFHPGVPKGGVFKGRDYIELGYDGQEGNGLVARKAWSLLRLARMTGDEKALAAGLKALRYMDKFIVPRAAQVWEVPVHTPDILAAADACEAYLEAYEATGDRQWLEKAVYWEETGLPFLYQWDVDDYPWLRYASIPVFGASWMFGSWFGRPVQWNGLRWAYAALKLAQYDNTYPWRLMAEGVTISAMYQQGEEEGKDLGLWPDSISAIDGSKAGWIFAPRAILKNVYKILGYEPEPVTVQAKLSGGTAYVNGCGKFSALQVDGEKLQFTFEAPEPLPSRVVLCGISEPRTVKLNGQELPRRQGLPPGPVVGWNYRFGSGVLEISPGKPGRFALEISPVHHVPCELMPAKLTKVDFNFDSGDEGWRLTRHLTGMTVTGGIMKLHATGADPYMVRTNCEIDGDSISRIHVREAVSAGSTVQWFWATADEPTMAEARKVEIPVIADGQFHDYYLEVGKHPQWRGKKITSIRLDPTGGAPEADIKIDFIRGE